MRSPALIEMRNIVKIFPQNNLAAANEVSFSLKAGEIHGLVGENGAGKTTLMNILSGLIHPDRGEILVSGEQKRFASPKDALRCGIGMIHQHPFIIPEFSVWENIILGHEPRKRFSLNKQQAVHTIRRTIDAYRIDFSIDLDMKMTCLTASQMRKVSLIAMLLFHIRVLILDEPTSTFTEQEKEMLFSLLTDLRSKGWGIIFITHKIEEITALADRITVLRKGSAEGTVDTNRTTVSELSSLMLGEPSAVLPPPDSAEHTGFEHEDNRPFGVLPGREGMPRGPLAKATVLEAKHISVGGKQEQILHDISFSVHTGEIVAIVGIREVGLETLEDVLSGFRAPDEGTVIIEGIRMDRFSPSAFRKRGISYIPTERLHRGASLQSTVRENIILHRHRGLSRRGILSWNAVDRFTEILADAYAISAEPKQPLYQLSGGNINKVIIARELSEHHTLIIFTEPTWGLDMNAGAQVLEKIKQLRNNGKGILIISSDIDEVLHVADTIVVLREGIVSSILPNREVTKRMLGRYLLGLNHKGERTDDE